MTEPLRPLRALPRLFGPRRWGPVPSRHPPVIRGRASGWQPCLYVDIIRKYRHILVDMSIASTYRTEPGEQDEEFHGIQSRTGLQRFAAAASSG